MANITKVYEIKLTGQKELVNNMDSVSKSFDDAKARFVELKSQIGKGGLSASELQVLKLEFEKTKLEMMKLKVANQELTNEGKAYTNASRIQRDEERKSREEKKLTLSEYQKLSKELNNLRTNAKEIGAVFGVESQEFKKAASEANKLDSEIKKIDASLGQFQRNVGNYPKTLNIGSINSDVFKELQNAGLGDVLGNQLDQTKGKVIQLHGEFRELKTKLNDAKNSGVGDLNAIEKEIIQNRIETDKLNNEIRQSQTHINGLGGVGSGVFGRLNADVKSLVLGYVGLNAAMSTAQNLFNKSVEFDSVNTAIKAVSRETADFDTNQNFLEKTTERLGLKLLDTSQSFKNFFAASTQSGISAEKTREIFESASEASAVMKLSQEQTNGVMLAFGQIASKGKVQAEELRGQIGERIPGAFGIAAKAMNMTTQELDKLMSDGKLYSKDFLPKFAEELKKTYGAGQEPVNGLRAELNRLGNEFDTLANNSSLSNSLSNFVILLRTMIQTIKEIPFAVWIAGLVSLIAYYVSVNSQIIINRIETIRATIATNAQTTSTNLLASANLILSNNIKVVRSGFQLLFTTIKGNPITALVLIVGGLVLYLGKLASKNQDVVNSFNKFKSVIEQIKPAFNQFISIFSKFATEISEKLAPVIVKLINGLLIPLAKIYFPIVSGQIRVLSGTLNVLVGEFLHNIEVGKNFAKGIIEIYNAIKNRDLSALKSSLKGEANIVSEHFKGMRERIKKFWDEGYNGNSINKNSINKNNEVPIVTTNPTNPEDDKKEKISKTSDDRLKRIEDEEKKLIAIEKARRLKNEVDEEMHQKNILNIKQNAIDKKLQITKNDSLQEKELQLERIQNEIDTNKSIFELKKKQLEENRNAELKNIESIKQFTLSNPAKTEVEKKQAEVTADVSERDVNTQYYDDLLSLEVKYRQDSVATEKEKVEKIHQINQKLFSDLKNLKDKNIVEIQEKTILEINLEKLKTDEAIKSNKSLNETQKERSLKINELIAKLKEIDVKAKPLGDKLKEILGENGGDYEKLKSDARFKPLLNELVQLQQEAEKTQKELKNIAQTQATSPSSTGVKESLANLIKGSDNSISVGVDSQGNSVDGSALLGDVIGSSFDFATQAMNSYFDAERQRIEQSKQLAYERIDLEKQQRLNLAQSTAEKESIERQAREKKKQADKEAGEKLKKTKKTELQISLATELANIAVAAAQNPANGVTFGAAGIAMYGILAALALAKYAVNSSNIDKAQFGRGGFFGKLFGRGGKLTGPSHSDNNGMPVINPKTGETQAYLEGGEGIVNKNSMSDNSLYSVSGTPAQIVSRINTLGGGIDFLGGASLSKYQNGGEFLGTNLQPPVFRSYYENRTNFINENESSNRLDRIEENILNLAKLQERESYKKVIISSREMSDVQRENSKQSEIATL